MRYVLALFIVSLSACEEAHATPTATSTSTSAPVQTGAGSAAGAASVATSTVPSASTLHLPSDPGACVGLADVNGCVLEKLYANDDGARALATSLREKTGSVAGVHDPELLDGGFRGTIRIVPAAPTGKDRQHLRWMTDALFDFDEFFAGVAARAGASSATPHAPSYRWRGLSLLFFRSVDRTTPSAFASDWSVAYNVQGSLNTSADGVRETMFHEIFHLNDGAHRDWSSRILATDYAAIVKKCGTDVRCLAPYAPGDTKVRGGTFYAFQGNNGVTVREYGAELALRWYREHRALLRGTKGPAPFKCGPPENARAWRAIVDEFFHADLTPPCP